MVLADTSVWISHFRSENLQLVNLLEAGEVSAHPFVIGELACGGLHDRDGALTFLRALPSYSPISDEEFHLFLDSKGLGGKGIGFVGVHLLASVVLNSDFLWTLDGKLARAARSLRVAY